MRAWSLAFCLVAATFATSAAEQVVLTPDQDNTLFEDSDGDTSNGGGPALFAGKTGSGLARRALLRFDLSDRVPPGAKLDSVVLSLHVSNAPNGILRRFTLHRVGRPWGEGASYATGGTGDQATSGDATWLHTFHPGQSWSVPGGDFDPTPSASLLVSGLGTTVWFGAAMTADVAAWLDQPGANHGWLLLGDETVAGSARRFDSREAETPADRPTLTIFYRVISASHSETWGSIKARYR